MEGQIVPNGTRADAGAYGMHREAGGNPGACGMHLLHEEYIGSTYRELTHLGRKEGAGAVLVQHRGSGRIAVKKIVSAESAGIYQRLRELEHPNIARIYEICRDERGSTIIEEFVSGETLEMKLDDGPLPEDKVIKYAAQILDALQELHKRNIIHRDITPSNVLVSSDDVVRLIDFGISRNWKADQKKDTAILGTVGYAAPEQFGFQQTDITADFYALGVLINVMLTGQLPAEKRAENKKLAKIIQKCIQMDPAKRYQAAAKIRRDLTGSDTLSVQREEKKDISVLPGFRSNVLWKKIIGTAGCVLMAIYAAGSAVESMANGKAFLLETAALLLLLLSFLVGSNFARWDRKMPVFRNLPKEVCIVIRVTVCLFLFLAAIEMEDYVRFTILKLPRTG